METNVPDRGRFEVLPSKTIQVKSSFGKIFVTLNENGSRPFELFLRAGKSGSDIAAYAEAIGRLCSLLLRIPSPVPERKRLESIAENLSEIGGSKELKTESNRIRSMPDALAFAIRVYLDECNRLES